MSKQPRPHSGPCPRCNTGWYTTGRSLSVHLTMHCNSALLWDRLTSISGNVSKLKRSHSQMLNGSTVTFVQQARTFNLVPNKVPVQLRNRLLSHPPLSYLASTQNNFNCSNGLNQEFEMGPTGVEQDRGSGSVSAIDAVNRRSPARDLSLDNVEVDLNSADQLLWRCPQCSYGPEGRSLYCSTSTAGRLRDGSSG